MCVSSIKRTADERRQRSTNIIDEKRNKYRPKNASLQNTSTDLKGATFVILKNYASEPNRKERLSPTSKARREASRNKLVKKNGVPDRGESFGEVHSSRYRSRTRLGFVKPIRNRLRKIKILIKSRPYRAETGLAGKENGVGLQREK